MTMLDPYEAARKEQSRRRATRLLSVVLGLSGLFCVFLLVNIISPPPKHITLGQVDDFPVGETVTRAVPRLDVSTTIQNRPPVSEDILYITHFADGSWRAVLGWDSQSGCIVRPADSGFVDPCSGRIYDQQGLVTNEPQQRRFRLGLLTINETPDQDVVLVDQFAWNE